jgi:hypothetical protein
VQPMIAATVSIMVGTTMLLSNSAVAASTHAVVFKNCTQMHKTYPHGVGRVGARDRTTGKAVTNFKRSNALYAANIKSDRDHDKIACEAS